MNERYDNIKELLKKSRNIPQMLNEINVAKSLEKRFEDDEYETSPKYSRRFNNYDENEPEQDSVHQEYRINSGLLSIHGNTNRDVEITTDEKIAFQQTMDEFTESVADLVDFDILHLYTNSVEWSGKVIDDDLDFIFTVGENGGIYIKGNMVRVDEEFLSTINRLQQFYQKFKSKWSRVLAKRKKTRPNEY